MIFHMTCLQTVDMLDCQLKTIFVRAVGTVQKRYRVSVKGQMKEQAGFLVSRSVTLHPELYFQIFSAPQKRIFCQLRIK